MLGLGKKKKDNIVENIAVNEVMKPEEKKIEITAEEKERLKILEDRFSYYVSEYAGTFDANQLANAPLTVVKSEELSLLFAILNEIRLMREILSVAIEKAG